MGHNRAEKYHHMMKRIIGLVKETKVLLYNELPFEKEYLQLKCPYIIYER
jgi:hypothetical protein